ncbi:hypothetical protein GFL54_35160 [Rhizobium laguerreae]|nr:hypothetical protein [Rhizobium laguerreae]
MSPRNGRCIYQPIYKWRETWPGEGHQDLSGFDGEQSFDRIPCTDGREGLRIVGIAWLAETWSIAPASTIA